MRKSASIVGLASWILTSFQAATGVAHVQISEAGSCFAYIHMYLSRVGPLDRGCEVRSICLEF